jgi:hypothetical protein
MAASFSLAGCWKNSFAANGCDLSAQKAPSKQGCYRSAEALCHPKAPGKSAEQERQAKAKAKWSFSAACARPVPETRGTTTRRHDHSLEARW